MRCETSYDSSSHQTPCTGAIALEDIGVHDKVLIRTKNSEYRFSVIDPVNHKGLLSGGALGDEPREAFLIESRGKGESGDWHDFRGLRSGARALFYLSSGNKVERVTTSEISGLTLVKAIDRDSFIS